MVITSGNGGVILGLIRVISGLRGVMSGLTEVIYGLGMRGAVHGLGGLISSLRGLISGMLIKHVGRGSDACTVRIRQKATVLTSGRPTNKWTGGPTNLHSGV